MTERIGAVAAIAGGVSRSARTGPAAGELAAGAELRVSIVAADADGLVVVTGNGQTLRLPGLVDEQLSVGGSLTLKVLAPEPHLILQPLMDVPESAARESASASLREVDQLQLNRLGWAAPEAGRLATAWRVQVLSRLATQLERNAMALGQRIPAWLLQADPEISRHNGVNLAPNPAWWIFPMFAWGGIPMTLSLYESEADETVDGLPLPHRELSLRIALPGFGLLALRLRLTRQGLLLTLAVESETARSHVQACAEQILDAARQSGGRLQQFDVRLLHAAASGTPRRVMRQPVSVTLPPRQLFELAAQILIIIAQPQLQPATVG